MGVLNDADSIYLGGDAVSKVMLGTEQVWPAPTSSHLIQVGNWLWHPSASTRGSVTYSQQEMIISTLPGVVDNEILSDQLLSAAEIHFGSAIFIPTAAKAYLDSGDFHVPIESVSGLDTLVAETRYDLSVVPIAPAYPVVVGELVVGDPMRLHTDDFWIENDKFLVEARDAWSPLLHEYGYLSHTFTVGSHTFRITGTPDTAAGNAFSLPINPQDAQAFNAAAVPVGTRLVMTFTG